jgi:hypothetical protein
MNCRVTHRLAPGSYRDYRLDAIFHGKKWDPQIYDRSSIADRALIIGSADWAELCGAATELYAETLTIETELQRFARKPDAKRFLPAAAWRRLQSLPDLDPGASPRLMRFDFHPTEHGWRLSEVNSDVPGGLNESSLFPELWPARSTNWTFPGHAGRAYVQRVAQCYGLAAGARVGLVHATAFSDDWQHMAFLQTLLAELSIEAIGVSPTNVELLDGRMLYRGATLDAALRFFPGDWLLFSRWGEPWFTKHPAALSNPLHALFSQNKFFPVVCAALGLETPAWRRYLPRTTKPAVRDLFGAAGLLKPSFGRVGEDIERIHDLRPVKKVAVALDLLFCAGLWIRQEEFAPKNLGSADEPINACVGVYCLDGDVIGGYGRITSERFVGMSAADSPVFICH